MSGIICYLLHSLLGVLEVPRQCRPGKFSTGASGDRRRAMELREVFDTLLEAKVLIERWRRRTTRSGHTVPWATNHRRRKRSSPVRSLRLRLSKRTGLVCGNTNPNLETGSIPGGRSAAVPIVLN